MSAATLTTAFERLYHHAPVGIWSGPGRVNLIGEHTDYNDGFVLPFAIDRQALVAVRPREDRLVRCASTQHGPQIMEHSLDGLRPGAVLGWTSYVLGVAWALSRVGTDVPGFDLLVDSDIPMGAGLSSSAGLETATGLALSTLAGSDLTSMELALACHRAETDFVGAPVGVMDQVVSACAEQGCALLLDCRSLEVSQVGFDPSRWGCALLVIDTGVAHQNTSGAYAERRAACEKAAAELGVVALRDADLQAGIDPRARHVVTECRRVLDAVEALRSDDVTRLGALLVDSHVSLRDDFQVSCPELDLAVDTAMAAGAHGARLTGAGFGGCAIALVPEQRVGDVTEAVLAAFADQRLRSPNAFPVSAGPGARRLCLTTPPTEEPT